MNHPWEKKLIATLFSKKKISLVNYNPLKKNISGFVSTIAGVPGVSGFANGPSPNATFYYPSDMCDDGNGNIYVADSYNYVIRLINTTSNSG